METIDWVDILKIESDVLALAGLNDRINQVNRQLSSEYNGAIRALAQSVYQATDAYPNEVFLRAFVDDLLEANDSYKALREDLDKLERERNTLQATLERERLLITAKLIDKASETLALSLFSQHLKTATFQ